jgi:hypothetical protein
VSTHDLHPRSESQAGCGDEPGGPDVRPMTSPGASDGIRAGIRCTAVQPISAGQGSVVRPEVARSEDENIRELGRGRIGLCCGNSRGLQSYADQCIQWPNSR